jgi:hypothetical protein
MSVLHLTLSDGIGTHASLPRHNSHDGTSLHSPHTPNIEGHYAARG